jgi:hypothetical protein
LNLAQIGIASLFRSLKMQLAHNMILNTSSCLRQSVQQVCRLPQQQQRASYNSSRHNLRCSAAGVAVSVPDTLPTDGLKKSYSAAAVAEQPDSLPAEIKSVLFSEQQVREKVAELAAQICRDYKGKPLAVIGVLNGAFIFTSGKCVGSSWSHSLAWCWAR